LYRETAFAREVEQRPGAGSHNLCLPTPAAYFFQYVSQAELRAAELVELV